MNRDDIIRMALAGKQNLRDRISYAIALEREACAALCDKISDEDGFEGGYADRCAFAIRERGAP